MRRIATLGVVLMLSATSCVFGGGEDVRTVLVDFSHDEFASYFIANFPKEITVTPGTKLVFKQTWTGEPHTVTAGSLADEAAKVVVPLIEKYGELPEEEVPEDVFEKFDEAMSDLPWAFDEGEDGEFGLVQTVAQPCYLDRGTPPTDGEPCETREQPPAFTGREAYYNSGLIPYEGPGGNTFEVQLADDIEPGSYMFYCAVHGPFQRTEVEVKPAGSDVPSADEVNRQARREIDEFARPLRALYKAATDEGEVTITGTAIRAPFGGLWSPDVMDAAINEFVPRTATVRAGDPITWKLMGADHSISFDVPEYFPIVEFLEDGTVRLNPDLQPPAGGAPEFEPPDEGPPEGEDALEGIRIDGGTYDGEGFWSSGLVSAHPYVEYTLRISKPGTYKYACLLHPPMVGTIEVTA